MYYYINILCIVHISYRIHVCGLAGFRSERTILLRIAVIFVDTPTQVLNGSHTSTAPFHTWF